MVKKFIIFSFVLFLYMPVYTQDDSKKIIILAPLYECIKNLEKQDGIDVYVKAEVKALLEGWQKKKTREKVDTFLHDELRLNVNDLLLIWEIGGKGEPYQAIVLTKTGGWNIQTYGNNCRSIKLDMSSKDIQKLYEFAIQLRNYEGWDGNQTTSGSWGFCSVWTGNKPPMAYVLTNKNSPDKDAQTSLLLNKKFSEILGQKRAGYEDWVLSLQPK